MDMLPYVDSLIKEYFLFRGFTASYHAFETDSASDKSKVFNAEDCASLLLDTFLPSYQSKRMVSLCQFLESNVFSKLEPELQRAFKDLTSSVYKKYVVNAIENDRTDKVTEFFDRVAGRLRHQAAEWGPWFSIQYVKNAARHPDFALYFTKAWSESLRASLQNLLSRAFHKVPMPSILRFHLDRLYRRNLQLRVEALEVEKTRLETLLAIQSGDEAAAAVAAKAREGDRRDCNPSEAAADMAPASGEEPRGRPDGLEVQLENLPLDMLDALSDGGQTPSPERPSTANLTATTASSSSSVGPGTAAGEDDGAASPTAPPGPEESASGELVGPERETPGLGLDLVSSFQGHEAPIVCCRYSPDGDSIASSSSNGTVRVWSADDATPSNRNVTIRTACKVLCLEWEPRRQKLVLFGTSLGTVKGWNVDSKRFVFDVEVSKSLTDVVCVKCSPRDPVFAVVASTPAKGAEGARRGSLSLWNSRSSSKIADLSVGRSADLDSAVTCAAFSADGKSIAAGSLDGMVTLYDCSSKNVVAGFPVGAGCSVWDVKFGAGDASLWTLSGGGEEEGSEGGCRAQEWRLATTELIREVDLGPGGSPRDEIAIDPSGSFLASTLGGAGCVRGLGGNASAAAGTQLEGVVSVDWNPNASEVVVGSSSSSVVHIYEAAALVDP